MRKFILLFPFLIAIPYSIFFLRGLIDDVPMNWEELALGKETFSPHYFLENGPRVYAKYEGKAIHCEALEACSLNSYNKKGNQKVLWLGNSQLHAINQFKEGQMLASEHLFRNLLTKKLDLLTVSFPSANLQEHFVIFNSLSLDLDLSVLIVGVVFDDFREDGIRFEIANSLSNLNLRQSLSSSQIGIQILEDSQSITDIEDEFAGVSDTFQEKSETALNRFLENSTELWDRRAYLRGYFFNSAYKLRNYIFNINPSSKRRMILPRYKKNWLALEAMLKRSKEENLKVFVYVAPIRDDVELPYVLEEYNAFKQQLNELATKYNSTYINLEDLVKPEDWGLKDSTGITDEAELDYMHFQERGHIDLSNALFNSLIINTP